MTRETNFAALWLAWWVALPVAAALAAVWAETRVRPSSGWRSHRGAFLAALAVGVPAAAISFAVHYADVQQHRYTETSGLLPIAIGLGVPLIAAAVVRVTDWCRPVTRVAAASVAGAGAVYPLAAVGQYLLPAILGPVLPRVVWCCPL